MATEQRLKQLARSTHSLDSHRLIQPDRYGSWVVILADDPMLDTLIAIYAVLITVFVHQDVRVGYRPSPYARRFLQAFETCTYLQEEIFSPRPSMDRRTAESTLADLNHRLESWRACLSQPDFAYERQNNQRKSRDNYRRMRTLLEALLTCYSRLTVVRVDLGYTEWHAPYIDYETARQHRQQLSQQIQTHPMFQHLVGHVWKLEWGIKKGFHYHVLFFFNGHQVREDVAYGQQIGELWNYQITDGQGHYHNCNRNAGNIYQHNALGVVDYHDQEKIRGLDFIARYLTKMDEYASIMVQGRTFQTSRLPEIVSSAGRPRHYPTHIPMP